MAWSRAKATCIVTPLLSFTTSQPLCPLLLSSKRDLLNLTGLGDYLNCVMLPPQWCWSQQVTTLVLATAARHRDDHGITRVMTLSAIVTALEPCFLLLLFIFTLVVRNMKFIKGRHLLFLFWFFANSPGKHAIFQRNTFLLDSWYIISTVEKVVRNV